MAHLKELKAYLEIGQALDYTGEALQKYVEAQIKAERQREADLAKQKAEADERERQREADLAKLKAESEVRIEREKLEHRKALELADRETDKQ